MPAAYSYDLRERVVAAVGEGVSRRHAARQFKVGISTVIRWVARLAASGSCAATPSGGDHKSKAVEMHKDWLLDLVKAEPDLTLTEIHARLHATHGLTKSFSCLWRFFARHDISFKKTLHAAEQDREDVKAAREVWRGNQASLIAQRLVFIDETATATNMTRLRGRAPKGERLIGKTPHGHRKTTTFIAALRCDSVTAPMVLDGAMNGAAFIEYVRQVLVPTLKSEDVVIMDNLPVHKVFGIKAAIESVGASVLFLPPYSPDLNPIEMAFSKLKALLRKASERTVSGLWDRIGELIGAFSSQECENYLTHQGYGST
jgi:transposase